MEQRERLVIREEDLHTFHLKYDRKLAATLIHHKISGRLALNSVFMTIYSNICQLILLPLVLVFLGNLVNQELQVYPEREKNALSYIEL